LITACAGGIVADPQASTPGALDALILPATTVTAELPVVPEQVNFPVRRQTTPDRDASVRPGLKRPFPVTVQWTLPDASKRGDAAGAGTAAWSVPPIKSASANEKTDIRARMMSPSGR
jgi:hypothetical protein